MKQLLLIFSVILLFSSCKKDYYCYCFPKHWDMTTITMVGVPIMAANEKKALNNCKVQSTSYQAYPDSIACEVYR